MWGKTFVVSYCVAKDATDWVEGEGANKSRNSQYWIQGYCKNRSRKGDWPKVTPSVGCLRNEGYFNDSSSNRKIQPENVDKCVACVYKISV